MRLRIIARDLWVIWTTAVDILIEALVDWVNPSSTCKACGGTGMSDEVFPFPRTYMALPCDVCVGVGYIRLFDRKENEG